MRVWSPPQRAACHTGDNHCIISRKHIYEEGGEISPGQQSYWNQMSAGKIVSTANLGCLPFFTLLKYVKFGMLTYGLPASITQKGEADALS